MNLFFNSKSRTCECVPIPIDGYVYVSQENHSENRAGHDVITKKFKCVQCPLCKKRYSIGDSLETEKIFIPYNNV
jgi:hypothetical protein